ncbi:MAG: formate C-acetyltransferase/glycerol dehydratase family glycyl radical enzyme, partial [Desulfobacterales bacterium]|nr:formate C-acetyltransferase/glycerol dehydratase family glycyl radical enzyme [Desulfobacterales bacterium]
MNTRIEKLRNTSLAATPSISGERAALLTDFYEKGISQKVSIPVQRALAFKYILENKEIFIDTGELIVGERGPAPKATPTYPEVCLHSTEDLVIFDTREKVSFKADEATKDLYSQRIIPFWQGKTIREKIFDHMSAQWQTAYQAGVFTEFQEQRSPGHTVLGSKIYSQGFSDFKDQIDTAIQTLDYEKEARALDRFEQLQAMTIAADALIGFAGRHAAKCRELAAVEKDETCREKQAPMARICTRVPGKAPETFWEALQYYWFVHVGVITELNPWDAFNPGRLD